MSLGASLMLPVLVRWLSNLQDRKEPEKKNYNQGSRMLGGGMLKRLKFAGGTGTGAWLIGDT